MLPRMQALRVLRPGRLSGPVIRGSGEERAASPAKSRNVRPRTKSTELGAASSVQDAVLTRNRATPTSVSQVVSKRRIHLLDSFPQQETEEVPLSIQSAAVIGRTPIIVPGKKSGVKQRHHPGTSKLRVAVDIDEVLGSFLKTLSLFCEEEYKIFHELEEFFIYDFKQIWKCSQEEANHRVHSFFDSHHFHHGIPAIPGASDSLHRLRPHCDFVVVTSRQHVIQQSTLRWLDRHYPNLFSEVHFGNHYALEGKSKSKSEICKEIGASVLIDDNPGYAMECANRGVKVLLFDWKLNYAWSKTEEGPHHPLITRVSGWDEVEEQLLLLVRN